MQNQLFCSIRQQWVSATPEEYVRQSTIQLLIQKKFPHSIIAVEKQLRQLPHLAFADNLPERRADILCYSTNLKENSMNPLLLIECKAIILADKELRQLIGYNHFVKAPFIALVNQNEHKMGWFDPSLGNYQFIDYIPHYQELINSISIS